MKLTAYTQETVFQDLRDEWNDLLNRSSANRIFSTWEWQSIWWQSYRPGTLWVITCRDESDNLIGIAPWFIEQHPQHGRVVRSIGCVEVTDYLDLIADREHTQVVFEAFTTYAAQHRDIFDVIDLCNLPQDSLGYLQFPDALRQQGFTVTIKEQEVCPIIHLPSDWEAYLETLDKKQRHEVRRKIRRAEGVDERVEWYIVGHEHNLQTEVEQVLGLMASSQVEKAQFLQDVQNLTFFKNVVPVLFERGWLQLSFLTVNGQPAATYMNFVYQNTILVYNSGLRVDLYSNLSPGIVLLAHNIRYAIEHEFKVFDFLRGNEIYKYRMGGQDTHVYMLRAQLASS